MVAWIGIAGGSGERWYEPRDDFERCDHMVGKNGFGGKLVESGDMGRHTGSFCSGFEQWDEPRDDIARWNNLDGKGDLGERVVFYRMVFCAYVTNGWKYREVCIFF